MPHPDGRNAFRLGLMPQWLDSEAMDHWRHGHISLALQHHSQVFIDPGRPSFNRYTHYSVWCRKRDLMRFQFLYRITVSCLAQYIRLLVRPRCDLDLVLLKLFTVFTWYLLTPMLNEPHIKVPHRTTTTL